MLRRSFIGSLVRVPAMLIGSLAAIQLFQDKAFGCEDAPGESIKSFAFYQGLRATEVRSPSRTDGTYSKMPCIAKSDIEAGVEKTYAFWHGHNGKIHKFKVTAEHFTSLNNNNPIELYTDLVDNHRHALKITPDLICSLTP